MLLQDNSPPKKVLETNYLLIKKQKIMKKTKTIAFLLLASALAANAQITKGNWMVGGSGSFYNTKAENETSSSEGTGLNIFGNIGYFPINKLAIGLSPSIGYSKTKGNSEAGKGYGIGLFTRYYFLHTENRINLFSHLEYRYTVSYSGSTNTGNGNNFIIKAGPAIYFNSSVGLEVTLNYENLKIASKNGSDTTFNNLNIGVGFQIHLEK